MIDGLRLERTWNGQVEEESVNVGLRREDALCRSQWIVNTILIATKFMCIWSHSLYVYLVTLTLCVSGHTHFMCI